MPNIIVHALRLAPGTDLKVSIQKFVDENKIGAGWIAACVGSLVAYNLRFADRSEPSRGEGHFEIVSLSGTLSTNGSHLHLTISDSKGITTGGHLLDGCTIYTTAEIIIQSTALLRFRREIDAASGFRELQIETIE